MIKNRQGRLSSGGYFGYNTTPLICPLLGSVCPLSAPQIHSGTPKKGAKSSITEDSIAIEEQYQSIRYCNLHGRQ